MDWLVSAVGAAIVAVALHDMFHTIWHPAGQGALSRLVLGGVWRGSRLVRKRARQTTVVGPIAILSVILTWGVLIIIGWTLIYWPHMAEGFSFGSGLEPSERSDLLDSLYLSLVTVGTLGYGDIVPAYAWLRLTAPLQAFIGFTLLTGAVSWILQIYPALTRRRTLAVRLALLRTSDAARALPTLDSSAAASLLDSLAIAVVQARVDLTEYSETYYFREADSTASLAEQLPYALELARAGRSSARADLQLAGSVLAGAVDEYARVLGEQFVQSDGTAEEKLERYAADHGYG